MMKIVIRRSELQAANACEEGLEFFRTLAPKGVLKIEWTPLVQCWLAVEAGQWVGWARVENFLPINNLARANLEGAYRNNDLPGWKSVNGRLERS